MSKPIFLTPRRGGVLRRGWRRLRVVFSVSPVRGFRVIRGLLGDGRGHPTKTTTEGYGEHGWRVVLDFEGSRLMKPLGEPRRFQTCGKVNHEDTEAQRTPSELLGFFFVVSRLGGSQRHECNPSAFLRWHTFGVPR